MSNTFKSSIAQLGCNRLLGLGKRSHITYLEHPIRVLNFSKATQKFVYNIGSRSIPVSNRLPRPKAEKACAMLINQFWHQLLKVHKGQFQACFNPVSNLFSRYSSMISFRKSAFFLLVAWVSVACVSLPQILISSSYTARYYKHQRLGGSRDHCTYILGHVFNTYQWPILYRKLRLQRRTLVENCPYYDSRLVNCVSDWPLVHLSALSNLPILCVIQMIQL